MVSFTILAGGYDTFIAAYAFLPDKGSLAITSRSPTGQNPSWLALHPKNSSILYAVNEIDEGALQSFTVTPNGVLSAAADTVSSGGGSPAFALALSTGQVAVVNYMGANGRVVPTTSPLDFVDTAAPVVTFPPPEGGVSHPHQVVPYKNELLIPDLGADIVWRLTQDGGAGSWKISGGLPQPLGSGPRHAVVKDDRLFVLHELTSTLSVQAIPARINATSNPIASVSIVPSDVPVSKYAAAELILTPISLKFPKQYLYASNRNVGDTPDPRGDSIAIFEHVNPGTAYEGFKLINQVFTGLSQVRGMVIGPAKNGGDEYLVAAGVAGTGGVAVFKRVDGGRNLVEVARNTDIATRTAFVWL